MRDNIKVLMEYGHSAFRAQEIALDALRGDAYAWRWIHIAMDHAKRKGE